MEKASTSCCSACSVQCEMMDTVPAYWRAGAHAWSKIPSEHLFSPVDDYDDDDDMALCREHVAAARVADALTRGARAFSASVAPDLRHARRRVCGHGYTCNYLRTTRVAPPDPALLAALTILCRAS